MQEIIKQRTKKIGLEVIKLIDELPYKTSSREISKQLIRCSTSIGCNYRATCRSKSTPDFINKLKIVEEEPDETLFWLELLEDSGLTKPERIAFLKHETNEILSIVVASIRTSKSKILNNSRKS